jgi:hypothetical protein
VENNVTGSFRKCIFLIVNVIKSRRIKWVVEIARTEEYFSQCSKKDKVRDYFGNLGEDGE